MSSEFMVLIPRKNGSIDSTPTNQPKSAKTVGDHVLIKSKRIEEAGTAVNSNRFRISGSAKHRDLITQFPTKSWQHKAWDLIGTGIRWGVTAPFSGEKHVSKKMKHAIRIGVAMKVRANVPLGNRAKKGKPILMQITPAKNDHGIYLVGCTAAEMIKIFEKMYDMMYNHVDEIVDTIDAWGYGEAVFIMKSIIVYDDKSFDAYCGDPRNLFKMLGIEFDKKGRVKL